MKATEDNVGKLNWLDWFLMVLILTMVQIGWIEVGVESDDGADWMD